MICGRIIQRDDSEEKANYGDTAEKSEENVPDLKTLSWIVMADSDQQSSNLIFQLQL
jgi:hypothetical protein